MLSLLKEHKENYTVLPFELDKYAKLQHNYSVEFPYLRLEPDRTRDVIHTEEFLANLSPKEMAQRLMKRGSLRAAFNAALKDKKTEELRNLFSEVTLGPKTQYVTNLNAVRNQMIEIGLESGSEWILPLDGNCFFTTSAWAEVVEAIDQLQTTQQKSPSVEEQKKQQYSNLYYTLPTARIKGQNEELLSADFSPDLAEEPQLIFHRTAQARFDPRLRYGRRDKVGLIIQLGIPGIWDN